jgi:hypothetical protein
MTVPFFEEVARRVPDELIDRNEMALTTLRERVEKIRMSPL